MPLPSVIPGRDSQSLRTIRLRGKNCYSGHQVHNFCNTLPPWTRHCAIRLVRLWEGYLLSETSLNPISLLMSSWPQTVSLQNTGRILDLAE